MADISLSLGKIVLDINDLNVESLVRDFTDYASESRHSDSTGLYNPVLYEELFKKIIVILCDNPNTNPIGLKNDFVDLVIQKFSGTMQRDQAIYLKYLYDFRVNLTMSFDEKKILITSVLANIDIESIYVNSIKKDLLDIYIIENNINEIRNLIIELEQKNLS